MISCGAERTVGKSLRPLPPTTGPDWVEETCPFFYPVGIPGRGNRLRWQKKKKKKKHKQKTPPVLLSDQILFSLGLAMLRR